MWSTEEQTNMRPGHFWICKFGTVPGSISCVEKKFELQTRKWEEYKDTRYYDGDKALVESSTTIPNPIQPQLLMICQDSRFRSGTPQWVMTMQVLRWQCSSTRASCAEVRSLQLDSVTRGGRRTRGAAVRKLQVVGNSTFVLSVENDNDFRSEKK